MTFKKVSAFVNILIIGLFACDDSDQPTQLLRGRIGGLDFTYKYANANSNNIGQDYVTELYGTSQLEEDPCTIFNSSKGYLSVLLPNEVGRFQVPSEIRVVFAQPGIDNISFDATSGFVDIIGIGGNRVDAYLQAIFDDDNSVEGEFVFERCL
jgi:hypothetical protein